MTRAIVAGVAVLVLLAVTVLAVVFAADADDAPVVVTARAKIEPAPPRPYGPLVPDLDALARMPKPPRRAVTDAVLDRLAFCESRMRISAVNGPYLSFFQWTTWAWHAVGMSGDPRSYSYTVQRDAARRLIARFGIAGQFPVCSRTIGAR